MQHKFHVRNIQNLKSWLLFVVSRPPIGLNIVVLFYLLRMRILGVTADILGSYLAVKPVYNPFDMIAQGSYGHGKPGQLWNFTNSFSKPGK